MQVDELQSQYTEELRLNTEKFEAELEGLKRELAASFEAFTEGSITAEGLMVWTPARHLCPHFKHAQCSEMCAAG